MTPVQLAMVLRPPRGDECQCIPCSLMFADERAFGLHITRAGHVHPSTIGQVERATPSGSVWSVAHG